ncbi:RmlC-like cupin domain-containing protein [Collybia nuda]|uniref:RmlC-like cupin domain-containing protein n=1 Tax=Collybia nuda TaxID=64659 RepID=A0A9P5YAR2_9AGAR|nr:RmlC-like cupin domain-containing protein [Collybia nuda]
MDTQPWATSQELIRDLKLKEHPEGGHFVLTNTQEEIIPSPFADGTPRPLASSIYYLLSENSPTGFIHMNKSITYHVLHHGRAEYTLITPGSPPTVERKVMGANIAAGETRMLLVGTGVWKMSRLLPEDHKKTTQWEKDHVYCLITEVVVPGFDWEDHQYMNIDQLETMFDKEGDGGRWIKELSEFIRKDS